MDNPISFSVAPEQGAAPEEPAFGLLQAEPGVSGEEPVRRRPASILAGLDFGFSLLIMLAATAFVIGSDGLGSPSVLAVGFGGVLALSATMWWRNVYVVHQSVKWDGNLSATITSIVGVVFGMICASWMFQLEPQRAWQFTIGVGWMLSALLTRFIVTRRLEANTEPVRVIVAGNTGDALATRLALRADPRVTYQVEGFVMDHLDKSVPELVSRLALGSIDQLPHVVKRAQADLVVVCLGAIDAERFGPLVRKLNVLGVDVGLSTGLSNVALRRVSLGHISGRPLVRVTASPQAGWQLGVKRFLDVIGAAVLLVVASPILLLSALAIKIEDGGSPIYKQIRVGKDGKPFRILKFRSMYVNADQMTVDLRNDHEGPVFKMTNDPRITKVGNILRKTSVDELPQLVNILKGEMSLVGPRPLPVHEVQAAPVEFLDRQAVKPGLTGRWQVSGRSDTGFKELDELDRWYVDNWSLGQDFEILARTVPAVLLARGAR